VADRDGYLWVLDNGNPRFSGNPSRRVIPGAPKLLKFDTQDGRLLLKIPYIGPDILPQSYLNDVRIDTIRGIAYLTDSGKGAIIVTDLQSGISHRLLDDHFSVEAEAIDVVIDGKPWRRKDDGGIPRVHADGIALSPDNTTLYFQALTGRTLYRISTAYLVDFELTPEQLGNKVEKVGVTGPADGIDFAPDGTLYLTSLEDHAVKRLMSDGTTQIVVQHHLLEWPDSFAMTGDGTLYITTSRIHLGQGPYSIFRFKP
jgi:sugar lactone lactonase YvrE